jgi:hypothetical protein
VRIFLSIASRSGERGGVFGSFCARASRNGKGFAEVGFVGAFRLAGALAPLLDGSVEFRRLVPLIVFKDVGFGGAFCFKGGFVAGFVAGSVEFLGLVPLMGLKEDWVGPCPLLNSRRGDHKYLASIPVDR